MRGLAIHIGTGGKWIEIWPQSCTANFIGCHNLDYTHKICPAFNLGADTLEYLDQEIQAPRIVNIGEKDYSLICPLPKDFKTFPLDKNPTYFEKETLDRLCEMIGLSQTFEFDEIENHQEIKGKEGLVYIKNGICKTKEMNIYSIGKISWVISKLMMTFEI